MTGDVDGRPTALLVLFTGLGFSFNNRGSVVLPPDDTTATQNIDLHASLYFNRFSEEFFFDPDVDVTALFDLSGLSTATIALIVVFVIIGAVRIAGFAIWFSPSDCVPVHEAYALDATAGSLARECIDCPGECES
jgi:hypothetical protein